MLAASMNHPSIMAWAWFNEGSENPRTERPTPKGLNNSKHTASPVNLCGVFRRGRGQQVVEVN